jgi:hypothetical protein
MSIPKNMGKLHSKNSDLLSSPLSFSSVTFFEDRDKGTLRDWAVMFSGLASPT